MLKLPWPCRVARDAAGNYRVSPIGLKSCDGGGSSLDEAIEMTCAAVTNHLQTSTSEIAPPVVWLDPEALENGEVIRIEIDTPSELQTGT